MTTDLQALVSRGNEPRYVTELLRDIAETDTSLPVLTTAGRPDVGKIVIDNERIAYASLTPTSFEGCTRGDGQDEGFTEPRSHVGGTVVKSADRPNFERAAADTIAGLQDSVTALQSAQLSSLPDHATFAFKFGTTGNNNSQFKNLRHLRVDGSGNIYTIDATTGQYKKFTSDGTFVFKTGLGNRLVAPLGIAVDNTSNVWIVDPSGVDLLWTDLFSNFLGSFPFAQFGVGYAKNLCIDATGKVWLNDVQLLQFVRINPATMTVDLTVPYTGGGAGTGGDFQGSAGAIAIDPLTGYLHAADVANKQFQVYDPVGAAWQTPWGGGGGTHFAYTGGNGIIDLTFDQRNGWRYAADAGSLNVQAYDQTGVYKFSFGGSGSGDGQFNFLIAADARLGNGVVTADENNNRVQKFIIANATGGSGDVSSNVTTSSSGQAATFTGTSGKIITPFAGNGVVKATGGVLAGGATLNDVAAPTADVSLASHKLTNVTDPTSAQDAATKNYVDGMGLALDWKASVRLATTANGTLATAFANGQTIDSVVLATGDRILLKNQTTAADNGLYTVNASGAPTRATDAASGALLSTGATVYVEAGTQNALTVWTLTTTGTITVGTTGQTWANVIATSADNLGIFAATTSAQLAAVINDETGTGGLLVFNLSPSITTPTITTPTIASSAWTNANHPHASAAGGGQLALASAISDAAISSPANNDLLIFNSGTGKWTNGPASSLPASFADSATSYREWEDFDGGGTTDGNIGKLGWNLTTNGNVSYPASTVKHPGQLQLTSGNTSGNSGRITFGGWGLDTIKAASIDFSLPNTSTVTNVTYRIGFYDSIAAPSDGFGLEFDTNLSDTTWKWVKWVGGVRTATSSGVTSTPVLSAWCRADILWLSTGSMQGQYFDLTTPVTGTAITQSSISITAVLLFGFYAKTLNAVTKQVIADWVNVDTQSIGRN